MSKETFYEETVRAAAEQERRELFKAVALVKLRDFENPWDLSGIAETCEEILAAADKFEKGEEV